MPAKKLTTKVAATQTTAMKAVKKVAAKKTSTQKSAAEKTPAKKAVAKKAAKKPAVKKSVTTIVVKYNVGMGNSLELRGDAPGLSWDTGTIMENIDADTWQWTTSNAKSEFEVKFLINDTAWSQGENNSVKPGTTVGFAPTF
jgi:hypothetical protein